MDRQSVAPTSEPSPTGSHETANEPDWFQLGLNSAATLLKVGNRRQVWRVRSPNGSVIAKVFDGPPQPFGFFTAIPVFNPAQREAAAIRFALKRGVPTSQVIEVVRERNSGRSVLVVEDMVEGRSLVEHWDHANGRHRRGLTTALAAALARTHEHGFVHPDLHPENILVRSGGGGEIQVWFIDIPGARFCSGSVRFEQAVESLAQLDQSFHRLARATDRLRFLRGYLRTRRLEATHGRAWAQAVAAARARHAERLARRRDRRLRGNNKYFTTLRLGGGWQAMVALQLERRHVFAELEVLDRTAEQWRSELEALIAGQPSALLVERFRSGGTSESVAWLVHGSPARQAFEQAHRFRHRDQQAELVLGYAERRNSVGLIDAAMLIRPAGRG